MQPDIMSVIILEYHLHQYSMLSLACWSFWRSWSMSSFIAANVDLIREISKLNISTTTLGIRGYFLIGIALAFVNLTICDATRISLETNEHRSTNDKYESRLDRETP